MTGPFTSGIKRAAAKNPYSYELMLLLLIPYIKLTTMKKKNKAFSKIAGKITRRHLKSAPRLTAGMTRPTITTNKQKKYLTSAN